jgi:hypothetical protein
MSDEPDCTRCDDSGLIEVAVHHPDCAAGGSCLRLCPVREQRPCPCCAPSSAMPPVLIDESEIPF